MVVTKLAQNKNEFLVDIYIDDKYFKTVDKNFVVEWGLVKGKALEPDEINKLENQSIVNKLYNLARNRILSRPRSESEMRDYLLKKDKDSKRVEMTIDRLVNDNYINDKEFGIWWVDNRNTFRGRSQRELQYELLKKGVPSDIIKEVLSEYMTVDQEEKNIKDIAAKKLKSFTGKDLSSKEKREKLLSFLQRKGYNWDLIMKVQKELI